LKRKKQHEHTLEQTSAQISTLEQQIYSIEAANINRETLAAMEKAGKAMAQIHGKLNIDKVDETMYITLYSTARRTLLTVELGSNFGNSTLWEKRLPVLLLALLSANLSMKQSWMTSSQNLNKSSLITRC